MSGLSDISKIFLPHVPHEGPPFPSGITPKWRWNRVSQSTISTIEVEDKKPAIVMPSTSSTGTGCIPCSVNHLSTCSGLLSEALRFARKDGLASDEVVSRIGLAQDELNAMERVDLRAEVVVNLADSDKQLANEILNESRSFRHSIENLTNVNELEGIAAKMQQVRKDIGKQWLKSKLAKVKREQY